MPTFLIFKGGEKIGTVVGADPNKLKVRWLVTFQGNNPNADLHPASQAAIALHAESA